MQSQQYTNGGPAHRPGSNQVNNLHRGGDLIDPRFAQPNPNHTLGHRLGQQADIPVTTPFSQRGTPDGIFQSAPNPSQPASSHINHNLLRVPNPSQPDPQQASSRVPFLADINSTHCGADRTASAHHDFSDSLPDPLPDPDLSCPENPDNISSKSTSTPAPTKRPSLTPNDVMAEYEKKTLKELRDLQRTHITYKKLNQEIKIEAQNLYFEYQKKQHLLSLKYSRPFRLLTKYLGQCRTRQKPSNWHRFRKHNPDARKVLKNTNKNIGQRNKDVSKLYKQHGRNTSDHISAIDDPALTQTNDPNTEERVQFGKIFKSEKTLREEVKTWAEGVQLKLKELSDSFGAEGFLVLTSQDHRKPFFFQGGSIFGDEYLRVLIEEGDPMRKFAVWMAGTNTVKRKGNQLGTRVASKPPTKSTQKLIEAFDNREFCQGLLALNHKYISQELEKMYIRAQEESNVPKKDTRSWPGTDTAV